MKKKHLFLGLISLFIISCTQQEKFELNDEKDTNENIKLGYNDDMPILHFASASSFFQTLDELLIKSDEEQFEWAIKKNPETLLADINSCNDSVMLSMPKAYKALFNKKMRININDSILEYKNGELYLIAIEEKKINDTITCGEGRYSILENPQVQTRQSGSISFKTTGMNHQHEFKRSNSKYNFKYVHEFASTTVRIGNETCEILFFVLKLEYKGSGSWKNAGEQRDIDVNLYAGANINPLVRPDQCNTFVNVVQYGLTNGQKLRGIQGNIDIPVARVSYLEKPCHVWIADATGSITHYLTGDKSTAWTDYWN